MTLQSVGGIRPSFTIGDRLRKARAILGADMDVKRFADLLGVSKNTVTNYELENTAPERMKPLVIRQWALATGVDFEWLVNGDTAPDGGAPSQDRTDGLPITSARITPLVLRAA